MPRGLITGEELSRLPDLGPCELVDGRIVPMPLAKLRHGDIEAGVGARLQVWADDTGLGRVAGGGVGVYTRWNPDTVRATDILFISNERFAGCSEDDFLKVAPELVVEVLSPDDRWEQVVKKVGEYLSVGVLRVWVFDPKKRRVLIYRSLEDVTELGAGQILADEELLPGFSLPLAVVFRV
ncbi:MAG TPA: Uma2 family endonuclease [Thermoanaerobaculia bacterium]|nr:Uma2 family endonuclease [Thermoanaerobaculia bacterium]